MEEKETEKKILLGFLLALVVIIFWNNALLLVLLLLFVGLGLGLGLLRVEGEGGTGTGVTTNFCFFFGGGEETLLQLRSMWSLIKVSITLHWQIGHLTNCDVVIVVLRDDSSLLDFIRKSSADISIDESMLWGQSCWDPRLESLDSYMTVLRYEGGGYSVWMGWDGIG